MIAQHVQDVIELSKRQVTDRSGVVFNQHEAIDRIKAYRNQQYYERKSDAIFWDLGTSRAQHFSKNIDLDTKDLTPYGMGDASFVQVFILRMKFYRWMEDNKTALCLDAIADELADFGSCIVKQTGADKKTTVMNLSNMYFDQLTDDFAATDKVQMHYLTKAQVESKTWDNKDEITYKDGVAEIWEFNGNYNGEFLHVFGQYQGENYISLFEEKGRKDLYRDFHIGPYKGRWMRRGVYERLFKIQERVNQLVNKNAETQDIASTLLLRSSNPDIDGNVLTDVTSGDIINSGDLEQIALDNRSLSAFIQEMQLIERQADKLAFTPEVITGEELPSGTPFRSVATISSAAKSTFKKVRQYYGEQIGYWLKEDIFPSVVRGWNSQDMVEIARDELDVRVYDDKLRKINRWENFVNNLLDGRIVNDADIQDFDRSFEAAIETSVRKIKIPKNFFNFEYQIRTNITGEQVNKQQQNDAMFNAIQMQAANPAMANSPLFRQYLENNNINHWRLTPEQVEEVKQGATSSAKPIGSSQDALLAAAEA